MHHKQDDALALGLFCSFAIRRCVLAIRSYVVYTFKMVKVSVNNHPVRN